MAPTTRSSSASNPPKVMPRPRSWDKPLRRPTTPTLRFTARSWAKLHYLRDLNDSEVFCFGIASPHDPMLVEDLWLPKQDVSMASAELDEDDMARRVAEMASTMPIRSFLRVWLHTHPGDSAAPSSTDVETQSRIFGTCEWSVMGILAKGGNFHCELMWWGPDERTPLRVEIPHEVDWSMRFEGADPDQWSAEYVENVSARSFTSSWYKGEASMWPDDKWTPNEKMGGPLTEEEKARLEELAAKMDVPTLDVTDEELEELYELESKQNANEALDPGDPTHDQISLDGHGGSDHHWWSAR